jgi:hypothetical protein
MKFGIIKSKIDYVLSESFKNDEHFKVEMKFFKNNILENKNLSKLFYLYDELTTKRNMDKNIVDDYINQSITIYENTINKLKPIDYKKLDYWLNGIEVENQYENIDKLFSTNILTLENKVINKKIIAESLIKKEETKEIINLPISTMIKFANKSLTSYIEDLNESDKNELIKFLSQDEKSMKENYESTKLQVIDKLKSHKSESDSDTSIRINETISKINEEKFDKLNYFKLKNLNESL